VRGLLYYWHAISPAKRRQSRLRGDVGVQRQRTAQPGELGSGKPLRDSQVRHRRLPWRGVKSGKVLRVRHAEIPAGDHLLHGFVKHVQAQVPLNLPYRQAERTRQRVERLSVTGAARRQAVENSLKGTRLVQIIQVKTLQVLQYLLDQHFPVIDATDLHAGHAVQPDDDGSIPAPVAVDDAVAVLFPSNTQRLQHAVFANGLSQARQVAGVRPHITE